MIDALIGEKVRISASDTRLVQVLEYRDGIAVIKDIYHLDRQRVERGKRGDRLHPTFFL